LATSTVAALKGESAIAVGNVVGSNLFNVLGVLGVAALAHPVTAPGLRWEDVAVMLTFATLLVPMMWTGHRLGRREAGVLLVGYAAYIAFLASAHG
jgi:cation:H+ antiporter